MTSLRAIGPAADETKFAAEVALHCLVASCPGRLPRFIQRARCFSRDGGDARTEWSGSPSNGHCAEELKAYWWTPRDAGCVRWSTDRSGQQRNRARLALGRGALEYPKQEWCESRKDWRWQVVKTLGGTGDYA